VVDSGPDMGIIPAPLAGESRGRGMLLRARKRLQIGQQYRAILGSQIV